MVAALLPILVLISLQAHSAVADDYIDSLKIAQRKVERQRGSGVRGSAAAVAALNGVRGERAALISSDLLTQISGRPYEVGDTWEVLAIRSEDPLARMTSDPSQLKTSYGRTARFRYTVREASQGTRGRLVVQIEQVAQADAPAPDPRVRWITLTLALDSTQTRKEYQIGRFSLPVSPEGIRSPLSALEFFPLDLPEIRTADTTPGRDVPPLPDSFQKVAGARLLKTNASNSLWFEQDDFFGRPVQALWRKGDPWPAYLKTANGIAVLLAGGTSR